MESDTSTVRIIQPHSRCNWNLGVRIDSQFSVEFHRQRLLFAAGVLSLVFAGGCGSQDSVKVEPHGNEMGLVVNQRIRDPILIQLAGTEHRWRAEYLSRNGALCITSVDLGKCDMAGAETGSTTGVGRHDCSVS